jgi:hypothetical protein
MRPPGLFARSLPRACAATCITWTLATACVTGAPPGPGTGVWPRQPRPVVRADLTTQAFDSVLPFDRRFVMRFKAPEGFDSVQVVYGRPECIDLPGSDPRRCANLATATRTPLIQRTETAVRISRAVPPNTPYSFRFRVWASQKDELEVLRGVLDSLKALDCLRQPTPAVIAPTCASAAEAAVRRGDDVSRKVVTDGVEIVAWSTTDFRDHFDTDFGAVYGGRTGYVGVATFLHAFATPVQQGDVLDVVESPVRKVLKTVNLIGGLAVAKLDDRVAVNQRFGFGSPVVGVGLRNVQRWEDGPTWLFGLPKGMRLNGGVIWLSQDDANPLVTRERTKLDWFVSASFDADVKSILGPLAGIIGIK